MNTTPSRLTVRTDDCRVNPDRLSYFYSGLDQKLVGVEGAEPIKQII